MIWVILPVYNEAKVLSSVLDELEKLEFHIVAVDDRSTDDTFSLLARPSVIRLRHRLNLGQGAALKTGLQYALKKGAETIVTFDADGQMDSADIKKMINAMKEKGADVALGCRQKDSSMPFLRAVVLQAGRLFTNFVTGLPLSDTHNGFRCFTRKAATTITISQNRMAHSSEILHQIAKNKLKWIEVPVTIRYTAYSIKKGQSSFNFINILWDLLFK